MVDGVWAAAPPLHAARATAATRAKTPTVVSKRRRNMQDLLWTNGTNGRTPERGILSGDGVSRAGCQAAPGVDRKSTRLNSSHVKISYAVFCLKKKRQL